VGFWFWLAGAHISPPESWDGYTDANETTNNLPPLRWQRVSAFEDDIHFEYTCDWHDDCDDYDDLQDLAGHLRKGAYSFASHRMVRHARQRKLHSCLENNDQTDGKVFKCKMQVSPFGRKSVKTIKRLQWQQKYNF
jgi:hypothetical protein